MHRRHSVRGIIAAHIPADNDTYILRDVAAPSSPVRERGAPFPGARTLLRHTCRCISGAQPAQRTAPRAACAACPGAVYTAQGAGAAATESAALTASSGVSTMTLAH